MIKIEDAKLIQSYINKYSMDDLFSINMQSYMELTFYKKGEYMIKDSERMSRLMFIVNGKAKAFTTLSNGKSLLLRIYQEFEVLGDLEILDYKDEPTNVQAITDIYCIEISYEHAKMYLIEDAKFLRFICGSLGTKLKQCSKNSSINLLYSLENRLASYIYTTGEVTKDSEKERIIFDENLTHTAELLGTSYRHLLRTLTDLCKKGILKREKSYYLVIDVKALAQLSADLYR